LKSSCHTSSESWVNIAHDFIVIVSFVGFIVRLLIITFSIRSISVDLVLDIIAFRLLVNLGRLGDGALELLDSQYRADLRSRSVLTAFRCSILDLVNADETNPATRFARFLKSLEPLSNNAIKVSRMVSTGKLSTSLELEGSNENNRLTAACVSCTSGTSPLLM
jgi:hypothetical protein